LPRLQGLHRWSAPARARSHGGTDGLRQAECRRGPMYGACDFRRLRFQNVVSWSPSNLPSGHQAWATSHRALHLVAGHPSTAPECGRLARPRGRWVRRLRRGQVARTAARTLRAIELLRTSACRLCPGDTAREPPRTLGAPSEAEACGSWAVRPRTAALTCKRGAGFLRTRQTASCACVGHSAPEGRAIRDPICIMRDR